MSDAGRKGPQLIAVDGPSASGKSTVARLLAAELGWAYLDTGATYRAVTLAALRDGCRLDDAAALGRVAESLTSGGRLYLNIDPSNTLVRLDGADVTTEIRGARVTSAVSAVSAHPQVRVPLVGWQRDLARAARECVLEGRDTGTVVVPDARLKVWLTARAEVRAHRRTVESGVDAGDDLARRDTMDARRAADPMRPAPDAIVLDSSELTAQQIVSMLIERIRA